MGRHGSGQDERTARRASWPVVALVVLLLAAIGLGIWWWTLRGSTDPIDADPVDGYAVVVTSPSCTSNATGTVVDLTGLTPTVRATLNGCGLRQGQRIAVQYLSGSPDQVRLAGTSTAGRAGAARWLPLAILAAGVLAVGATIVLLMDRRRPARGATAGRVSVADLQRAAGPGATDPARPRHHRRAAEGAPVGVAGDGSTPQPYAVAGPGRDAVGPGSETGPVGSGPDLDGGPAQAPADLADLLLAGAGTAPAEAGQPGVDGEPAPDETARIAIDLQRQQFQPVVAPPLTDELFTHRGPEVVDR